MPVLSGLTISTRKQRNIGENLQFFHFPIWGNAFLQTGKCISPFIEKET